MIETTPTPIMTDTELENWFADAGLTATVVGTCPYPTCPSCPSNTLANAA
ncbi:MAG TPA: hypothetical protein VFD97_09405 [Acidimicrobiia bacterium]|nr:hypothetical protein [Acidimicrobiia bacterium]